MLTHTARLSHNERVADTRGTNAGLRSTSVQEQPERCDGSLARIAARVQNLPRVAGLEKELHMTDKDVRFQLMFPHLNDVDSQSP